MSRARVSYQFDRVAHAVPSAQLELAWRPGGLPAWLLGPADGAGLGLFAQAFTGTVGFALRGEP